MRKKKEVHEEHVDETWLIPYADMLTLLLALFIVMFAMGQTDKEKLQQMSEQFSILFSGGSGYLEREGNAIIPAEGTIGTGGSKESKVNKENEKSSSTEEDKMKEIKNILESEIQKQGFSDKIAIVLNDEGLGITIQDTVLFASAEAKVFNNVSPILYLIAKTLSSMDNNIRVVGHTDNIPIRNKEFSSNWDLSAARAINVMHFLIEKGSIQPNRLAVQGNGEYTPRYSNSTEEGRAKNRRVEIVIIRKYPFTNNDTRSASSASIDESKPSAISKSKDLHNSN